MPETRDGQATISATRWAAAGFLGGASLLGMLWATLGRAPATPVLTPPPLTSPVTRTTTPTPGMVRTVPDRAGDASGAATELPGGDRGASSPVDPVGVEDSGEALAETTAPAPVVADTRLDINTATRAELELLPRIGPTLAARIIEFREREGRIRSLSHLQDVKGIGERTAERLGAYIRFE